MRKIRAALVASVLATVAMGFAATTASADRAAFTPGGGITARNVGAIRTTTGFGLLSCSTVTLNGTLTAGRYDAGSGQVAIGSITSGSTSGCTLGGVPIPNVTLSGLPWTIAADPSSRYVSGGVNALVILGVTFTESTTGCPFRGNVRFNIGAITSGTNALTVPGSTISGACGSGTLSGAFSLSPGQTITTF